MHLITELAFGMQFADVQHWNDILSAVLNAGRTEGSTAQDAANGIGGVSAAGGLASAVGSGPNSSTPPPPGPPPSRPPADNAPDARGSEQGHYGGTASHAPYTHPDGKTGDAYDPGVPLPPNENPGWPLYFLLPPVLHHAGGLGKAAGLGFDAYHVGHDLAGVPGHGSAPGPHGSPPGGH